MADFSSKQYSWSDVKINLLGRTLIGVQGVKYKITTDKEAVYGRGNKPLAIQTGNKTYEGELMLLQSEVENLRAAVKAVNPDYDLTDVSFDLVISYGVGNTAVTDICLGCEFTEAEKSMEQESKFMEVTLPFVFLDVKSAA